MGIIVGAGEGAGDGAFVGLDVGPGVGTCRNIATREVWSNKQEIYFVCQRSNPKKVSENDQKQSQSICNLTFVGLLVGAEVGPGVGACVGPGVGLSVGIGVGASVGLLVGSPGVTVGI